MSERLRLAQERGLPKKAFIHVWLTKSGREPPSLLSANAGRQVSGSDLNYAGLPVSGSDLNYAGLIK